MGATAGIATLAGGAVSAYSQYSAGKLEQKLSNLNATVSDLQAADAYRRGDIEMANVRRKGALILGQQRAGLAGQGIDINTGSAATIQEQTRVMTEVDAQTVSNNAALEAWGYKASAIQSRFQGSMARAAGTQQAIGTLLTAGSQAAVYGADWYAKQQAAKPPAAKPPAGAKPGDYLPKNQAGPVRKGYY
jgi:hypothetical protein